MAALLQTQLNLKNSPEFEKFWWKGKTQEDTLLGNFSHSKILYTLITSRIEIIDQ